MESEGYIEKKSKFMQQVGRQRQYCGTGWSAEGVKFYKDEQGLPFIDLDGSAQEAATMLMQLGMSQHTMIAQTANNKDHTMLVETVCGNFEGFTKNEVLRAKQA